MQNPLRSICTGYSQRQAYNKMEQEPLQSLVGDRIEKARHDNLSKSWVLHFESGSALNSECIWRFLENGVITSTSEDHGQMFGRENPFDGEAAPNEMAAYKILPIEAEEETGDINLKLGEHLTLQILPIPAGYESWRLKDKIGQSIVAVSGQFHSC